MWGSKALAAKKEAEEACELSIEIGDHLRVAVSNTRDAAKGVLERFLRRTDEKNVVDFE